MTDAFESTAPAQRRGGRPDQGAPGEASGPEAPEDDTVVASRDRRPVRPDSVASYDGADVPTAAATTEQTAITNARGRAATLAADVPADVGRIARAPEPADTTYGARSGPAPVIVPRTPAPAREAQDLVDTAAAGAAARRRARVRLAVVVVAASLILVAAAASLLVLLTTA